MLLHDCLAHWAALQPGAEFVADGRRSVTYREALAASNRIAAALHAQGLRPGARIAILSRNRIEYVLLCFAAARAGLVLAPLNCQLDPAQWAGMVDDAGARAIFAEPGFAHALPAPAPGVLRIAFDDGSAPAGWTGFDNWCAGRAPVLPEPVTTGADHLFQLYTSGTTGRPKGVLLSHAAVMANVAQIDAVVGWRPGERSLATLPLFHAAILPTVLAPLARGGAVFLQARFDPAAVLRVLDEREIAVATLVPSMIGACVAAAAAPLRPGRLRMLYYGAAPIAPALLREAMDLFGCDFLQSYGLTEATQAVTFLGPEAHRRALKGEARLLLSAGRPAPGTEIRIDAATGEILVRGPQLMDGYWRRPQDTRAALQDGWLRTGDAGEIDAEGYLTIRDRLKDIIISGGENVSSKAVEDVLRSHPAVAAAAVIGVPDARWGEAVKGVVVPRPDIACSATDLLEYCRARLSPSERPRSIDLVAGLPQSASGKVRKDLLRAPYWAGRERRVG